jgi:hypothetical protein
METRTLDVTLTEQEMIERSKKQADLVRKIEEKEAEKKSLAKEMGEEISKLTVHLQEVAREVRAGKKWVEVEVKREKDMARAVEETTRLDTGEVIETRNLTPQEMQLELVKGPAPKRKTKAN